MSSSASIYTVGRGRPPLHTRFRKGQSGNPGGKPGPAKLAKQRFQRALYAALEGNEAELERAKPGNLMAGVARRIALDAVGGRVAAIRLLFSLLDAACAKDAESSADEAGPFSLVQGKTQGNETGRPDADSPSPHGGGAANAISLVQGKTQGNDGRTTAQKNCAGRELEMPAGPTRRSAPNRSELMMGAAREVFVPRAAHRGETLSRAAAAG